MEFHNRRRCRLISGSIANGIVYVGSGDNKVYALNEATGKILWKYTTGGEVASSPAISNGIVYVGSYDGKVYALDTKNGDYIWSYATGEMVVSSPALASGMAYIGSYNHMLYAFGSSENLKTYSAPFPTFIILFLAVIAVTSILLAIMLYRKQQKSK